jgi:hypothetical protein
MAESMIGLFKAELHRNLRSSPARAAHWRGLDDLEIAACAWVSWFNDQRFHGEWIRRNQCPNLTNTENTCPKSSIAPATAVREH